MKHGHLRDELRHPGYTKPKATGLAVIATLALTALVTLLVALAI